MEVLGDVFGCLQRMTQLQLLCGFLAFTGYALAQGSLFGSNLRLAAAGVATLSGLGFVVQTDPWVYGIMLAAFAVAGIGIFAALVWMLSRMLGFAGDGTPRAVDSSFAELAPADSAPSPVRALPGTRRPAHSL